MFYDPVYDTIRRRGGYIFREEGVDTGAYILGGITDLEFENHKNVKNLFCARLNKLGQIYVHWDTKTQILR